MARFALEVAVKSVFSRADTEQLRCLVFLSSKHPEIGQAFGESWVRGLLASQVMEGMDLLPRRTHLDPRVQRIQQFLEENYFNPELSVERLAPEVKLSPARLRKLFRRQASIGPKEYLGKIRLREATRLLRQSTLSVKEIAARTGFSNDHYFHLVFRTAHSCTPSEFRSQRSV